MPKNSFLDNNLLLDKLLILLLIHCLEIFLILLFIIIMETFSEYLTLYHKHYLMGKQSISNMYNFLNFWI